MADNQTTQSTPDDRTSSTDPSSLKGLTAAVGIEPAKPGEDSLLGCDIGGVRIIRLIAEGGMGRVYEGKQDKPNRTVAVKVMRPGLTSPSILKRFEYEAEVLGRLQHPGIAHIYSVGVHRMGNATVPYFVMEYIADAKTLTKYAKDLKLPVRQRLDLFRSVCEAVAHGHQKGVIHRDLKPTNILVDGSGQPKVIDFGVARATDSDIALTTMQTDVGQLIGTLQYMSPEQFRADPNDIDVRSDVYALGVILYELLAGKMPYDVKKKAIHEVARIVQEDDPTPLSSFNRALKGDVAVIAGKCLEKERGRRYSSASELGSDIGRYLAGDAISASAPSFVDGLVRLARKHRVAATAVAGVFTSLVLAVVGISVFASRTEEARRRADNERRAADEARAVAEEKRQQADAAERRTLEAIDATQKQSYVSQLTRLQQLVDQRRMDVAQPLLRELIQSANALSTPVELEIFNAQCDGAILALSVPDLTPEYADRRRIAVIDGKTVRVTVSQIGGTESVLEGHDDTVKGATFSFDFRRVATTSLDKTIRVWDCDSGRLLSVLRGHADDGLDAVAFSPDATKIATATAGNILRVWDVVTASAEATLVASGHQGRVSNIAFSQDAELITTMSREDKRVCLWAISDGALLEVLSSPNGFRWFGDDKRLQLMNTRALRGMISAEVIHDGLSAAVTDEDATTVRIRHIASGEDLALLTGHQGPVTAIEFSADGRLIRTISAGLAFQSTGGNSFPVKGDENVRIWDAADSGTVPVLPGKKGLNLLSVAFSPDGNRIATVDDDGTARIWDAVNCTLLATLVGRDLKTAVEHSGWQGSAQSIAFSPDGTRLATAPVNHAIAYLWDTGTGRKLASLNGREELAFGPDSLLIATTAATGTFLWDARTGARRAVLAGTGLVAFSPNGEEIATAGGDAVRIFSIASGTTRHLLPTHAASIAFSPDGTRIASGGSDDTTMWDAKSGSLIQNLRGHYGIVTAIGFSPGGETVITAAKDRTARIWDACTGKELAVCSGHNATIRGIAFSPDGLRVATASEDHTCRVWDAKSGVQLAVLAGHKGPVWAATFSPDGKTIVTVSSDGTARLWGVSNAKKFRARVETGAIEKRLNGTITKWLKDGPDAAVAKMRAAKAAMKPNEYRVASNMILSRSAAMSAPTDGK